MIPSKEEALQLLIGGYNINQGPWKDHSIIVAECAYKIAKECNMDEDKAYIFGLLHDIGRRFGVTNLAHVIDGYDYLMVNGYEEVARICITHSFAVKDIDTYIGKQDVSELNKNRICKLMNSYQYDDYDRLIQVCDSIAMPNGPVDMEERMRDIKVRYGYYPINKWNKHLELKQYFEIKMGKQFDDVVINKFKYIIRR